MRVAAGAIARKVIEKKIKNKVKIVGALIQIGNSKINYENWSDKYIDKNPTNNMGLDLLANTQKLKRYMTGTNNEEISISYNTKLRDFKDILINRIERFDPLKQPKDNFDNNIKLQWLDYITNNLTNEKQAEVYNILGLTNN